MRPPRPQVRDERGVSLVELVVALTVIAVGVLAVCQMMPAGARGQTRDRMRTQAGNYAQQQLEVMSTYTWSNTGMSLGRHPDTGADTVGAFRRLYTVDAMSSPLDNLRKVVVQVTWTSARPETVSATTYLRR